MTKLDNRRMAGLILIVVGLGVFVLQLGTVDSEATVASMIGAIFLIVYLLRRVFGFLVPAGILLGFGLGRFLEGRYSPDSFELGLGCGFVFIFVVAQLVERRAHWWPLIPGGILIVSGFDNTQAISRVVFEYWPLALVAVGLMILFGLVGDRTKPDG